MLTDNELAQMRADAERALPGTAVILTRSIVSDGGGGGTATWTASGTVPCRLAPIRGNEREIADRVVAEATSVVTLPAATTIDTDQRLAIGGGTFGVVHVRNRDEWNVTKRVEAVEVK